MKGKFKRLVSWALVLCMLLTMLPTGVFAAGETRDVASESDLLAAVADGNVDTINLTADITLTSQLTISRSLTLDGVDGTKTITRATAGDTNSAINACILVDGGNVTIQNLTVSGPNTRTSDWDNGEYGIKVYNASATLKNVTVKDANAGIQVNGSAVNLRGDIDVSDNEWGGIEVCHSGELDMTGASFNYTNTAVPAIWTDAGDTGTVTGSSLEKVQVAGGKAYYGTPDWFGPIPVTYYDDDGLIYDSDTLKIGDPITISVPMKGDNRDVFAGWYTERYDGTQVTKVQASDIKMGILSLYAHYDWIGGSEEPNPIYTVSFAVDDTVVKQINVYSGYRIAESDIPAVPAKEGYENGRWDFDFTKAITGDTTINAVYDKFYTVAFENEDGTVAYESQVVTAGDKIKLPAVPAKEGSTGLWSDGTNTYAGSTEYEPTGNVTLTAQYTANLYQVTKNIGSNLKGYPTGSSSFNDVTAGTKVQFKLEPDTGYAVETCYIWYGTTADPKSIAPAVEAIDEATGIVTYSFLMPADNVTIRASVAARGNLVKFFVDDDLVDFANVATGESIKLPDVPDKEGYETGVWTFGGNTYNAGESFEVSKDVSFTAVYSPKSFWVYTPVPPTDSGALDDQYNFTVDPQDSFSADCGSTVQFTVKPGTGYAVKVCYLSVGNKSIAPVVEDIADDGTVRYSFTMPAGDVTIHASVEPKGNLVKFYVDGDLYDFKNVATNETVKLPAIPEKEGYTHTNWTNGSSKYEVGYEHTVTADIDFFVTYAKITTYTVSFQKDDGTVAYETMKVTDGTKIKLPEIPKKAGYTGAWSDGEGLYNAGAEYEILKDTSFRMVYTNKTYTVSTTQVGEHITASVESGYTFTGVAPGKRVMFNLAPDTGYGIQNCYIWYYSATDRSQTIAPALVKLDETTGVATYSFTMPAANVIIYATAVAEGNLVKYYVDGDLYDFENVATGSKATRKTIPEKTGYTADFWTVDGTTAYDFNTVVTAPISLNAKYTAIPYTVGKGGAENCEISDFATGYNYQDKVTFTVTPNDGYNVTGCYVVTASGEEIAAQAIKIGAKNAITYSFTMPAENCKVYATAEANTQLVRYEYANGNLFTFDVAAYDSTYKVRTAPEAVGYDTFWTLNGTAYTDATIVVKGDLTFVLGTTAKTYTVTEGDIPHGAVSGLEAGYHYLDEVTFKVTPEKGYNVTGCYVKTASGGRYIAPVAIAVGDDNAITYSFTMPADHCKIYTTAEANTHMVSYYVDGDLYDFDVVSYGDEYKVIKAPKVAGYYTYWRLKGTGKDYDGGDTITIQGDLRFNFKSDAETYNVEVVTRLDGEEPDPEIATELKAGVDVSVTSETGNVVTYTVKSKSGSNLIGVAVTYKDNSGKHAVTNNLKNVKLDKDGIYIYTYEFVMPAGDTTISIDYASSLKDYSQVKFVDKDTGYLYDVQLVLRNGTVEEPAEPEKEGYTFDGWYDEDGNLYNFRDTPVTEETLVLYAVFEATQVTVTYDAKGGDLAEGTKVSEGFAYGSPVTLAAAPTRTGYSFVGWQDDVTSLIYQPGAKLVVTGNVTLNAVWAAEDYIVKFVDSDNVLINYFAASYGDTITVPEIPAKDGFIAPTVWTAADGTTAAPGAPLTVTGDAVYSFAYTASEVTVTYEANGGTLAAGTENKTVNYGTEVTLAGAPSKDGCSFVGWQDADTSLIYQAGAKLVVTRDVTLTAVWAEEEFVVKFVSPDGVLVDYFAADNGESITVPAIPAKDGYTADTVWTAAGGATAAPGASITVSGDAVYTFEYTAKSVLLYFNSTIDPDHDTFTLADFGQSKRLPSAVAKDGYTFIGWRENDTGLVYSARGLYTVTRVPTNGFINFTAVFVKNDGVIVKFKDEDTGVLYDWFSVDNNDYVTAPDAPTKDGFVFAGWVEKTATGSDDSVAAGGNAKIISTADRDGIYDEVVYVAAWTAKEYTLHVQSLDSKGQLTIDGAGYAIPDTDVQVVAAGTKVTLTAEATNDKFAISEVYYTTIAEDNVTVKVVLTPDENGVYSFTMPAAETWLHIVSTQNVFNVTTDPGTGVKTLTTSVAGAEVTEATVGSSVKITVAADQDYAIDSVYAMDAAGNYLPLVYTGVDADGNATYAFTMPAANVTVYATAVKAQYTLTVLDYNNNLIDMIAVESGKTVDLSAYEAALVRTGYQFEKWSVIVGEGAEFVSNSSQVRQDTIIRAAYTADAHTVVKGSDCSEHLDYLKVSASASNADLVAYPGSVIDSATDEVVTIEAKPEFDYVITGVVVKGVGASNTVVPTYLRSYDADTGIYSYQFTMPAEDVEVVIYTEAKEFTVTVNENIAEGGDYTINGYTTMNLPVKQDETVTIPVVAADGYSIKSYSVSYPDGGNTVYVNGLNNVPVNAAATTITFGMVSYDVTVDIVYEKNVYNVTCETPANGKIEAAPVTAGIGDKITVTYTPDAGYALVTSAVKVVDAAGNTIPVNYVSRTGSVYTYEFTMPASDVTVSGEFAEEVFEVEAEKSYVGGTVTVGNTNTNVDTYKTGETAKVYVTPADGYRIKQGRKEIELMGTTYSVEEIPVFILKDADGNELFNSVDYALEQKIKAGLGAYYTQQYAPIVDVTETVVDGVSTYSFDMPPYDVYVEVKFEKLDYTVDIETTNAANADYGVVKVKPANTDAALQDTNMTAQVGDWIRTTVTVKDGYVLQNLKATYKDASGEFVPLNLDIMDVERNEKGNFYLYTIRFRMPAANVKITAKFVEDQYQVIFRDDNKTMLDLQIVDYKYNPVLTRVPVPDNKPGYHFVGWISEDTDPAVTVPSTNAADFVIVKDTVITAVYEKDTYGITYTVAAGQGDFLNKTESAYYLDTCKFSVDPTIGWAIDTVSATYTDENGIERDVTLKKISEAEVGCGSKSHEYSFVMPACKDGTSVQVIATFKEIVYTNNVKTNEHGTVKLNTIETAELDAAYNAPVTVDVVADAGYRITRIAIEDTCSDTIEELIGYNPDGYTNTSLTAKITYNMPHSDVNIFVEYAPIVYTITDKTSPDANGSVAITKADVAYGDAAQFVVTPEIGYEIDTVSVTYTDTMGDTQTVDGLKATPADLKCDTVKTTFDFTMPASDVTIEVTFKEIVYTNTVDENAHGTVKLNTTETATLDAAYNAPVTVDVQADEGYRIESITIAIADANCEDSIEELATYVADAYGNDDVAASITYNMPHSDVTITVVYKAIVYTVTDKTTDPNGKVTVGTPTAPYKSEASFHVDPDDGYMIDTVEATYIDSEGVKHSVTYTGTPDDLVKGGDYTFTMPAANVEVVVTFTEITYTVSVEVNKPEGCDIQLDDYYTLSKAYDYKDTVTLTVTPAAGWEIESVTADNGVTLTDDGNGVYTFTMPVGDVKITVNMVKTVYSITPVVAPENTGSITVKSDAVVDEVVKATVAPEYGYHIVNVTVTGDDTGAAVNVDLVDGEYVFTMPAESVTVTATFEKNIYTVTFYDWNGDVLKIEEVAYLDGATAPADPEREGYTFIGWDQEFDEITHDLIVTALYQIKNNQIDSHAISFTGAEHGLIDVVTGDTADYNDKVLFIADPDDGWRVAGVSVVAEDGTVIPVTILNEDADYVRTYTFVMPDQPVKINVYFKMHAASNFTDVRTDHWYYDAVEFVSDRGYFVGVTDELFGPNQNMSRAMFVTVLGRVAGVDATLYADKVTAFTDVPSTAYYAPYVAWAAENGIVAGITPDTFAPTKDVTREQMAAFMTRFAKYLGCDTTPQNTEWMNRYSDLDQISAYAEESITWCVGSGIMLGTSQTTISPKHSATRAQVAQVIRNLCDHVIYQ